MEKWKNVVGFEGLYQVSDMGNVRLYPYHKSKNHPNAGIIKLIPISGNYQVVNLTKNKIKKQFRVHRLVCEAFIPNPLNKPFVNHIDTNPANNKISNLEWCTQKENINHSLKLGTMKVHGSDNGNSKLTPENVLQIRKIKSERKISNKEIASMFGVEKSTVGYIIKRKLWNHI